MEGMFIVYVVANEKAKIYIGQTANLEKRLKRHNNELPNKKSSYSSKNPGKWRLFYKEEFSSREAAIKREKELKSYQGRLFLRNLIASRAQLVDPPAGGLLS